ETDRGSSKGRHLDIHSGTQSVGLGIPLVQFDGFFEMIDRFSGASFPLCGRTAQEPVIGVEIHRRLSPGALGFSELNRGRNGADHVGRDPILEIEHVLECSIETVSPYMNASFTINELSGNANLPAGFANASLQDVADAELLPHLPYFGRAP